MKKTILVLFCILSFVTISKTQESTSAKKPYLNWTISQAKKIGKSMRAKGKVGSSFDGRWLSTNRAINYKLRATLLTPEVIRATARIEQIRNRLTDEQTQKLVAEAEEAGDVIVMVEINPNEGSGVIPLDWRVFLQPRGLKVGSNGTITGIKSPQLRNLKALNGVNRRNYNYDVFWVAFPLFNENNKPIFDDNVSHIELLVGIYNKEGRVVWRMPESIRKKIKALTTKEEN